MFGLGIDNAFVSVDNYELPILDGSAAPFLVLLDEAGVEELDAPRRFFVVKSTVEVVDPKNPQRFIRVEPSKHALVSYSIDFEVAKAIGRQALSMPLDGESFCREFSYARTFCLFEEVEYMKSRGLARGGSLENAIVVSRAEGVLNTNGLRDELEFVRHKILDCVGDLALLGMPLVGHLAFFCWWDHGQSRRAWPGARRAPGPRRPTPPWGTACGPPCARWQGR